VGYYLTKEIHTMSSCKKCGGFGFTQTEEGAYGIPRAIQCECVFKKALEAQAERTWDNLSKVPVKKKSPLNGKIDECLVINAEKPALQVHLRASLADWGQPSKFVKVVNDATLMSAWLSNLNQSDIADPDYRRDLLVASLEDLAESPHLLIIRLGVKRARNSAMSEVLVETLELRNHLHRATWIVEEPTKPLQEGHLSWSRAVEETISGWERLRLTLDDVNTHSRLSTTPTSAQALSIEPTATSFNLPASAHKRVKL